jgi:DNA-binding response OmpR family regulator
MLHLRDSIDCHVAVFGLSCCRLCFRWTRTLPVNPDSQCSWSHSLEGSNPPLSIANQSNRLSQPLAMVVENDAKLAACFVQGLSSRYRVVALPAAEIALDRIRETPPDLVIAESALPDLDAIELCRRIRGDERSSHIPVILLSTQYLEADHVRALEAGVDDYFPMPFSTTLLLARISNLLESRRRLLERCCHPFMPRDLAFTPPNNQFVRRVREVVEQHLSDSRFNAEDLARNLALSRRQLFRKFKGLTGQTPHGFLRSMRLQRAAQLLTGSEMTVMQITFAVGFDDLKHFRSVFRQYFGVLPSQFAKASLEAPWNHSDDMGPQQNPGFPLDL